MAEQTSLDQFPATAPVSETTEASIATSKPWWFVLGLSLSVVVGGVSSVCIKQLLLPIQTSLLAPHNTNTAFTLVASVGAVAGLIASPLVGAFSDRTSWRFGRRRPWIALGIIVAVAGMLIMASARSIPLLVLGEICAQIGVDTVLAVTTAIIPDQIPPRQRAFTSACAGMAPNVGGVIGLLLVAHLTNPSIVWQGYVLIACVSLGCVAFFLLVLREPPAVASELPPPLRPGPFVRDFVQPFGSHDFRLTFASRCCAYLSFTILGAYLLFYVHGALHASLPAAASSVATFQLLSTVILLVCALVTGSLSHYLKKIKVFAIGGAVVMALGLVVMVVSPTWAALFLAAGIFGGGFGLFLGVGAPVMASVSVR